ncbi:hypothetical protein GUJ93_ZPchr0006g45435 [Zizania palustris]|uniref:Uncharacterized protein n=1 Tax=Zizania palustris TaxID=103762 RepID=A0A8J5T0N7_ZIZPA|nr:hypothetical protein GUJ93_ZPchr0006g45435 [Zizania palustris]KAG8071484.1 hypothetical protein GUJ93_ZPchr0006g45435 [Zizania palustris]KAG8071485.1 hypothetical protein GUJ93_ZPchr0006g45435 [Zizania palustris]
MGHLKDTADRFRLPEPNSAAEALSPHSHSQASPFRSALASMDSSPAPAAAAAAPMATATPPLEDCLRLLRGERDEQKLAGLLIAANVCRAGDVAGSRPSAPGSSTASSTPDLGNWRVGRRHTCASR